MTIEITDSDPIKISIKNDHVNCDKDLFDEFRRVINFLISIYKLRYEKILGKELTKQTELQIEQKMISEISFFPIDEIRNYLQINYRRE